MSTDRVITVYDVIDEMTQTSIWYLKRAKRTPADSILDEDVSPPAMSSLFYHTPGRRATVDHLRVRQAAGRQSTIFPYARPPGDSRPSSCCVTTPGVDPIRFDDQYQKVSLTN